MALLNRLFSSRKKPPPSEGYGAPASSQSNCKSFEFNKDQVRILLFRECERRGRKLLFDSKAVKRVPFSSLSQSSKSKTGGKTNGSKRAENFVEISSGFGYQYTRPSPDIKPLGEMIFGSVAMALRGSTFKVHVGGTPPVLMITKVANSPSKRDSERGLEDSYGSSINSMNELFSAGGSSSDSKLCTSSGSCPLDVPLPSSFTMGTSQFFKRIDKASYLGSLEGDSGCYTNSDVSFGGVHPNCSFSTSLASPDSCKGSGGSLSSLRRRWLRTASTSLDIDSNQSLTNTESQMWSDDKPVCRTKLGVAVIISLTHHQQEPMREYLLQHAALLESMAVRLNAAVERAYCRKELFVSIMYDASSDIEQCVEDLLQGPRLCMPVWLGLLTSPRQHSTIAAGFVQELCQSLEVFDTKGCNFFLSTLVTAVLTHHLGWVPTVSPGLNLHLRQFSLEVASSLWNLSDLPKLNPYNPLWAQAMDLYGALGNPLKTSRTIIMSATSSKSRIETIERLLRITSYFIRCAAINCMNPKLENFDFSSHTDAVSDSKGDILKSVDDRMSSSSTLRPISGKCSPLLSYYQTATTGDVEEEPNCRLKRQRSIGLSDTISSRSENALDVKDSNMESSLKHPFSVGLRRTMSYTSRISSAAILDNVPTKDNQLLSFDRENKKCNDFLEIDSKKCSILNTKKAYGQNFSYDAHPPVEKVVFVLGENDNLVGLKGKRDENLNGREYNNKTTNEGREKLQEQPLSFSGSEVESGFSECESFELSPVLSVCGNLILSKGKVSDAVPAAQSPSMDPRLLTSKNEKNMASGTCSKNFLLKEEGALLHDAKIEAAMPQPKLIGKDTKRDSLLLNPANLRSLERSVSVNLPVCLKSVKHEFCTERDLCVACCVQFTSSELKENTQPPKESKFICGKRSTKRLRRAHSSFCVQSQSRKSLKNVPVCLPCLLDQENFKSHLGVNQITCHTSNNSSSALSEGSRRKQFSCIELPLPSSKGLTEDPVTMSEWGVAGSLFGGVCSHYIPERALQGCAPLELGWEVTLKRDLALEALHPTLDPSLSEAVAIVANVDLCEVQLISSHTYVVDRPGTLGVRAGLSQLVANMLESVYHMWKLHLSPDLCLSFLESRLQEILLRSQALSELLLTTEFCDMDNLTSTLSLEPNDVPLLMSVASTHSPEITQRYGLSFR